MQEDIKSLSGREKEVLRLLLAGHDAKSAARSLDLSIHTVNERLRDARRKLGVSSSREAARRMAAGDAAGPKLLVPDRFGPPGRTAISVGDTELVPAPAAALGQAQDTDKNQAVNSTFAWLSGGMIVMWLAMTALVLAMNGNGAAQGQAAGGPPDLMPFADTDKDGKVTPEEYRAFSEQGWGFVARGEEQVVFDQLDKGAQIAFVGVVPNAQGVITRDMYRAAIPLRFKMLDRNGDGVLNADELNGRAFAP